MTDAKTLYDRDFVAWTEQRAEALRAAGRRGANQTLDWKNLAEEIESLGRSDKRELRSQIYRIIWHLLKLQFSPATDLRSGWRESIRDGRREAQIVLADSPSLKPQLEQFVQEETAKAIDRAITDLAECGKIASETERVLRRTRYSEDQILGDWFPPDPPRPHDRVRPPAPTERTK